MEGHEPAGWRVDPNDLGQWRYWDGARWTEYTSPVAPEERQWWKGNAWLALLLGFLGLVLGIALGGGEDQETTTVTDQITETVVRTVRAPAPKARTVTVTKTETQAGVPSDDYGLPPDDGGGGGGCHPEYSGACVPADAYDVDCGEVSATDFSSTGSDPYTLDADGDGLACES